MQCGDAGREAVLEAARVKGAALLVLTVPGLVVARTVAVVDEPKSGAILWNYFYRDPQGAARSMWRIFSENA
jgi:hypothetical protein